MYAYAAVAGALLLLGWQWHTRGQRIDELLAANGAIISERDQCRAQQRVTDEALAAMRATGEEDRLKRLAAERKAAQVSVDAERRVRAALTANVPEECDKAVRWLGDYGRNLANTWSKKP
jgi:hypothetical protein